MMVNRRLKTLWVIVNLFRLFPHVILFYCSSEKHVIEADLRKYTAKEDWGGPGWIILSRALIHCLAFRNVFYFRIEKDHMILSQVLRRFFLSSILSLRITPGCPIGPGLYIKHGYGTLIGAKSIGENCQIFQQVSIGTRHIDDDSDRPTIGNNVTIHTGAKILGDLTIGDHAIIGANAVVIHDVPADSVAVGVPARILEQEG